MQPRFLAILRLVFWILFLLVVLAGGAWYGVRFWPGQDRYRIGVLVADAGNIEPGARVRRGGLTIGDVAEVEDRSGQALLWLEIGERHRLTREARFEVATGPTGTDYVRVRQPNHVAPSLPVGAIVTGTALQPPITLGETLRAVQIAAEHAQRVTAAVERLVSDAGMIASARATVANLERVTAEGARVARDIGATVRRLERLAAAYDAAGAIGREVSASARHVTTITADIAATTQSLRRLAGSTEAAEVTATLAAGARGLAGTARRAQEAWERLSFGWRSSSYFDGRRLRSDAAALIGWAGELKLHAGAETGPGGGLTLQVERSIGDTAAVRTGSFRGEPGGALDWRPGGGPISLSAAAYRLPDVALRFDVGWQVSERLRLIGRHDDGATMAGVETRW